MRLALLHDPSQSPPEYSAHLAANQHVVFLCDVQTHQDLTLQGRARYTHEPPFCLVFDSLDKAEEFSHSLIQKYDFMLCEIFDHRGASHPPLRRIVHPKYEPLLHQSRSTRRMRWLGLALIAVCPIPIYFDWAYTDGVMVVPTFIGITLFISGLRVLYWSTADTEKRRPS